jgi:hypothetical protein
VGCDFHDEVGVEGCADSFQQGMAGTSSSASGGVTLAA